MAIHPVVYRDGSCLMIDQRRLPTEEIWVSCNTCEDVADAIRTMVVRGAPAIGVAAAWGMAFAARQSQAQDIAALRQDMAAAGELLAATRPTAVNLFWAIQRMQDCFAAAGAISVDAMRALLLQEADVITREDDALNRQMGKNGQSLFSDGATILTHCNAGALATGGYGTALGVIRAAVEAGKKISVYADETRPFLQGARLTAWELQQDHIPVTLICDNMAGWLMYQGKIDAVIVGADRIAANGDAANKIGTYSVAVLAKEHGIPFYVAAPVSTFDLSLPTGGEIPIEERDATEVTHLGGVQVAPDNIPVYNPAFDVTPAALITAIITEKGVIHSPTNDTVASILKG